MLTTGFLETMKINDANETKNVMMVCNADTSDIIFRKLIYYFRTYFYESNNSSVYYCKGYLHLHRCNCSTLAQSAILIICN